MADHLRRYTFHPLERRGALLGLLPGQIAVLVTGVAGALLAARAVPGAGGPALALLVLVASVAAAVWPCGGRPFVSWVPLAAGWAARRASGPSLATFPPSQATGCSGPAGGSCPAPPGIELVDAPGGPGEDDIGLIRDRRASTWVAVVPVEGDAFVLMDPDEQARRLESWRAVLATLARPGTPLQRLQWVYRSQQIQDERLKAQPLQLSPAAPETARESYRQLLDDTGLTQSRQAWLVLAVSTTGRKAGADRAVDQLRRELRLLDGHLRNANLRSGPALDPAGLRDLLAETHARQFAGLATRSTRWPWAMATDESWSALRTDGTWLATYWIAEWPRLDVPPDFLTPLLLGDGRRTVSVVMAPVSANRAAREARSARAADAADHELRARAGFLPSARRGREAEGAVQREIELADGHAEYRFSGYVTVTASSREELEVACVETQQAGQRAHLELRRLYGRQAEASTWTLPLGRGLA
jgi:hypothetical protein